MKTLIKHATAVLMDEAGTILPDAFVVVEGTSIQSVGADCPPGPFDRCPAAPPTQAEETG